MRHHRIHQYSTLVGQGQLELTPVTEGVTSVQQAGGDQPVNAIVAEHWCVTVQQRTRPWIWIRALASMTVALGLTGCATEPQTRLGAVGVEAEVGDLALRDVELANPPDGRYEVGSAARLNLAIVNRGRDDDQLTDVSGPAFDAVVVDDGEPDTPLQITIPRARPCSPVSRGMLI